MSLVRLLKTGNSLTSVKDTASPYRVTRQRLLPRFGPTKNPFSSTENLVSAQTRPPSQEDRGGDFTSEDRRSNPGPSSKPAAVIPSAVRDRVFSTRMSKQGRKEALRLRVIALLSRWMAKVGGLVGFPRGKTVKPAVLRFTKQPVQPELSLDAVKVARNDLSDADLEVVLARQPEAPAVPKAGREGD